MIEAFNQFDTYSLKARVFPALIAGFPVIALLFTLVPWDHLDLSHAIAASMGVVLLFALADMARQRGKQVQKKLGSGETTIQWHRGNPDVPEISKDTFRSFIAEQLRQTAPTLEDEQTKPNQANDFYRSAGVWLRDQTRDNKTYSLLFGENVTYGFRRNLLGLKPVAIICNILVMIICLLVVRFQPPYFANQPQLNEKMIIVVAAVTLHSAYMVFAVNKAAVLEASQTYGRQLILSCDSVIRLKKISDKKVEDNGND